MDLSVLHTRIGLTVQNRQMRILMIPLEPFHKQESNASDFLYTGNRMKQTLRTFIQEIDDVSDIADKYDISCIYDNHQWECSSYLGYGIGFPNSILSQAFQRNHLNEHSHNAPSNEDLEKFWNMWWDNELRNSEGKKGWDAQLEYFKSIIKRVNHKKSTLGFEILNEPQVFRQGDFKSVGSYHEHFMRNLNTITDKVLFLCYTNSASFNAINLPTEQAKTIPSDNNLTKKIIFDVHPYPTIVSTYGIL